MARRCHRVTMSDGTVALVTVEERGDPDAPCAFCVRTRDKKPAKHEALCDFPIHKGKDTKRYTCSKRLCKGCAYTPEDGLDFCPPHAMLVIDHGIGPTLFPLLQRGDTASHRVALDLVDGVQLSVVSTPAATQHRRFVPKGLVDWHEFYTERAAIYEFEANVPRAEAERRARADAGARPEPTPEKKGRR